MAIASSGDGTVLPRRDDAQSALPRSVLLLLASAAVVVVGAGIHGAASIVAPVFLALVLTIAVLPVVDWARHRGWPSWVGTGLALVCVYAIVLVLVLGLALSVVKLADLLPQYAGNASQITGDIKNAMTSHGVAVKPATTAAAELDPSKVTSVVADLLGAVLGALSSLFFLVTLLFFFCAAVPAFGARALALQRAKPDLAASLARFVNATQRYLVVTALFGAIVAVLDTGALWILGIPLPLLWGLFSFLTNFIPNIGFVVGVIPPALLALLDHGWGAALGVVLVYSVLNVTIQTFIQPRYVGATVGLSAEMTFLSLVLWTFLLGALGALLAVPMTLLVRAMLIDPDVRAAWVTPLISTTAEPPSAPPRDDAVHTE
jgi:predicted PurR-regulated permease PerM